MRPLLKLCACLLAISIGTTGCYRHTHTVGTGGDIQKEADYDEWESHWLFASIGETEIDVNKICASGNATVQDRISFLNGLVTIVLLGGLIWAPSTVRVYCAEGGGQPPEGGIEDAVEDVDGATEGPGKEVDEELGARRTPARAPKQL